MIATITDHALKSAVRTIHVIIAIDIERFVQGAIGLAQAMPTQAVPELLNTLRPRQNGHRFADDTFKRIFMNENVRISIKISLIFVPRGPINYIPTLVQIMAWRRSGDKPLSEPMIVSLLTHRCVTRPQ